MATATGTRADRLDAIVRKLAPRKHAYNQQFGVWPHSTDLEGGGDTVLKPEGAIRNLAGRLRRDDPKLSEADALKHAADIDSFRRQAPYTITTTATGRRITVVGDDGDTVTGVGASTEAALAALEAKLP